MKIQQIRNATVVLEYNGVRILVDPLLGEKGSFPAFPSLRGNEKNPLNDLPVSIDSIVKDVDLVIVTHTHIDHWDPKAAEVLDKNLPFIVQNEAEEKLIKDEGFTDVTILEDELLFEGVTLTKTTGQHYVDSETKEFTIEATGVSDAMGVVFSAENEDTLYLAGDTIWYEEIHKNLDTYHPEVILANAGGNQFPIEGEYSADNGRLLMNEIDIFKMHQAIPNAKIVATHMEAINHWYTSKDDLRRIAKANNFETQLFIPEDGETLEF